MLVLGACQASQWDNIQPCGSELETALMTTQLYGIDSNIDLISTEANKNVAREDRLVSPEEVNDYMLSSKLPLCADWIGGEEEEDIELRVPGFYDKKTGDVVLNREVLQYLYEEYIVGKEYMLDFYSEIDGKYAPDVDKIITFLDEAEDREEAFGFALRDSWDIYSFFGKNGNTQFHEFTHAAFDSYGFDCEHKFTPEQIGQDNSLVNGDVFYEYGDAVYTSLLDNNKLKNALIEAYTE